MLGHSCFNSTLPRRYFRSDVSCGLWTRFRGNGRYKDRYGIGANPYGRNSNHKNSQRPMLIEKFVKLCIYEGSLMVRHPFTIKVRGSYFDDKNNVDREQNKEIAYYREDIRDNHWRNSMSEVLNEEELKAFRDEKSSSTKPYNDSITELEESIPPSSVGNSSTQDGKIVENKSDPSVIPNDISVGLEQSKNKDAEYIAADSAISKKLKNLEENTLQSLLTELKKNQNLGEKSHFHEPIDPQLLKSSLTNKLKNAHTVDTVTTDLKEIKNEAKIYTDPDVRQQAASTSSSVDKEQSTLRTSEENVKLNEHNERTKASESTLTDDETTDEDDDEFYDYDDYDYDPYYRSLEDIQGVKVPMHVLFYGRNHHQVDSYSVDHNGKHQTHLYLSAQGDTNSHDGDDVVLGRLRENANQTTKNTTQHRVGNISIWQPRDIYRNGEIADRDDMNHSWCEDDNHKHGFTLYCSQRVLDSVLKDGDEALKTVFLVPSVMNKIDLQCDGTGNVEFDAGLVEDLEYTRLCAESGNVVLKDISCRVIKLSSEEGDIYCHGLLEGEMSAETKGNGDFIAKNVGGPFVEMTTQDGDITIWGDVKADRGKFHSKNGQISVHGTLSGYSEFLQAGKGDLTVRKVANIGAVLAIVRAGDIKMHFADTIDLNSSLEVETGNINITIPFKHKYRINAVARRVNIAPRLVNKGEIFLSEKNGNWETHNGPMEIFTTSSSTRSEMDEILQETSILKNVIKDSIRPPSGPDENGISTLTLIAHRGSITINVAQSKEEADVEKGYDSAT